MYATIEGEVATVDATMTVLVVDDDPSIVELVVLALEDEGYRVQHAVDGAALRLAQEEPPDLILLDYMMPGMDGGEVSRRLRADPRTAAVPIVMMSAVQRLCVTAADLPVDDLLPKPFDLAHLYQAVAHWARAA